MSVTLTPADIEHLARAVRTLASRRDHRSTTDWRAEAEAAVREVIGEGGLAMVTSEPSPAEAHALVLVLRAAFQAGDHGPARPVPPVREICSRFGLTTRQAQVAQFLAWRYTNPEIAEALCLSYHTVRRHVEAVLAKLDVDDRYGVEAALRA